MRFFYILLQLFKRVVVIEFRKYKLQALLKLILKPIFVLCNLRLIAFFLRLKLVKTIVI